MSAANPSAENAASSEKTSANTPSDFDQVIEHMRAIREDFAALAAATGKLAAGHAKSQARRAGNLAEGAAEKAKEYREAVADKVKDHPLASVGIAAAAGLVIASLARR